MKFRFEQVVQKIRHQCSLWGLEVRGQSVNLVLREVVLINNREYPSPPIKGTQYFLRY